MEKKWLDEIHLVADGSVIKRIFVKGEGDCPEKD
jgi:hypothetical protein